MGGEWVGGGSKNARLVARVKVNPIGGEIDPQKGLTSHEISGGGGSDFTLRNAFVYDHNLKPGAGSLEIDNRLSRRSLTDTNNPRNKIRMDKEKGLHDYAMQIKQDYENWMEEMEDYRDQQASTWTQAGITAGILLGLKNMARGGSAGKDDIPALLTSGEYVMSRESVEKYGVGAFNKLNKGVVPRFQNGGAVGSLGANTSVFGGLDGAAGSGLTNNVNITVNVDNKGSVSSTVSNSQEGQPMSGEDKKQGENLGRQIESAVMKVLITEKKQGGLLSRLK
jgi:hypothetical protein